MPPLSFDEDQAEAWAEWVLRYGLPDQVPKALSTGLSIPMARWAGPLYGSVLFVECAWNDDRSIEPVVDEVVSEVRSFSRGKVGWEALGDGGGGGWPRRPLSRPRLTEHEVRVFGLHIAQTPDGGQCASIYGVVGTGIHSIQLRGEADNQTVSVESDVGAVIVAFDGLTDHRIDFTDTLGRPLVSKEYSHSGLLN